MLTGNLVRVRHARSRLIPIWIDVNDAQWLTVAEQLLGLFRLAGRCTRGELEEEIVAAVGDNPTQLVHQGLAKLLEDRCDFDVESGHPPDELREVVFRTAAAQRMAGAFDRQAVLEQTASQLGLTPEQIDSGLYADLKIEQRLLAFKDCTAAQLLHRYNVALAQAILLRSTGITVSISGETPARYRQLFRAIKFHRLMCEIRNGGRDSYILQIDGPLSLFSATQKYGVQLANFLPSLLQCKKFELKAAVRWGVDRKEKEFILSSSDGLQSHLADYGDYVPKELSLFADAFRKQVSGWEISSEASLLTLGAGFWTPDFVLTHRRKKKQVYLEILGFWRRTDAEKLYQRLRQDLGESFLLAVSEQFNIDESQELAIDPSIYIFKRTPLPEEVAKRAEALLR